MPVGDRRFYLQLLTAQLEQEAYAISKQAEAQA